MNLSELLAYDNVSEECELRSSFGFMAFHGGELEEMTDIIASRAAERAGASYYGIQLPDNLEWHIPSHKVTADQSPQLASFLSHVNIVVTVHGFGRAGFFTSLTQSSMTSKASPTTCADCTKTTPSMWWNTPAYS
jgi:phage replication-related protein YjqB (UPF0714/DUF867 family)